jgi:parvulin-like peptidyl-prolyl isomerase
MICAWILCLGWGCSPSAPQAAPKPGGGPATQPLAATSAPSLSSGQYLTVGLVVAEVNGQPIFADRVLGKLKTPLAANAAQMRSEAAFRSFARDLIHKKILEEINDELEFAAAQRALTSEQRRAAENLTIQWRLKRLSESQGSEALAQARMQREEGMDLNEAAQRQFRYFMIRIYYELRVWPQAAVSAQEMRQYYQRNLKDFTQPAQIRFRVIRLDAAPDQRQAMLTKAADLRSEAGRGADFVELAATLNQDAALRAAKGLVDWVQKGSYRVAEVETAAWALAPGAISQPIEASGAIYLVQTVDKQEGGTARFEEQAVQEKIKHTLMTQRFNELRQREQARLWGSAFTRYNESMLDAALAMAMQNYPAWAAAGRSPR